MLISTIFCISAWETLAGGGETGVGSMRAVFSLNLGMRPDGRYIQLVEEHAEQTRAPSEHVPSIRFPS